jgi:hypothetical protein
MAAIVWEVVKKIQCDRLKEEADLLEERVYPDESVPDPARPYQVRARKCSLGMDCNLAGYTCVWAYNNPNYDPFAEE